MFETSYHWANDTLKTKTNKKTSEIAGSGNISEREKIQISYSYKQTEFLDKMQFENC